MSVKFHHINIYHLLPTSLKLCLSISFKLLETSANFYWHLYWQLPTSDLYVWYCYADHPCRLASLNTDWLTHSHTASFFQLLLIYINLYQHFSTMLSNFYQLISTSVSFHQLLFDHLSQKFWIPRGTVFWIPGVWCFGSQKGGVLDPRGMVMYI